ncbi:uncharacterized protein LOC142582214 isoform X4 [Dermacentor variabilis]|uniref:uncharacterized protein LOC142582214 isoform X4 n=1 Tax=Dermacentor variabilis TaxID=34621 RepID=UPI003F5BB0D6
MSKNRHLANSTFHLRIDEASGCVDPTGHLVNEGFSISRTRPCQLETCRNGTWDIARCIEDVDPKCKGQLGTRGPGPYPDCCALAVYCAGH